MPLMSFHSQFAGFMVVGMLIMLIFGIVIVVTRNKVITVVLCICLVTVLDLFVWVFLSILTRGNHFCFLLLATPFSLMLIIACHIAIICFPVSTSLDLHFTFLSFPECNFWMFSVSTHFSSTSLGAHVLFSSCRWIRASRRPPLS